MTEPLAVRFGTADYAVFVCMLIVSAAIGFYYACSGSKQKTAKEYLMADKQMGVVPITLSLLASFVSAIGLLGIPAEVYSFGTGYWLMVISYLVVMPAAAYIYLPVFYNLNLTSAYEYLERRFNRTIRKCGSLVFILQMLMFMAMVTYAPALALSQVTGMHVWASVATIGVVCVCYTTLGGMKAVMWTDAFQILVMISAMLAVNIRGLSTLGGFQGVWGKANEGNRLNGFDFNPDPLVRHTFWCLTFGGTFTWLAIYGVNQAQVQRYLSSPTINVARSAIILNLPGLFFAISLCAFTGLVLYANYASCDPYTMKTIKAHDQLLPLYVMEALGDFPGLPGFFVAGIFSGSLSSLSSGLNSLAAVTLEDFLRGTCFKHITEEKAGIISKFIALAYGVLALAAVAVVEQLGNILQGVVSIFGLLGGPLLGLFTLGMFFPWANSWGAGAGLFGSLTLALWMSIGAQVHKSPLPRLPVSIRGCNVTTGFLNEDTSTVNYNITDAMTPMHSQVPNFYRISYQWYSAIGCLSVIIIGLLVSFITGYQKMDTLDIRLLCPPIRALLKSLSPKTRKTLRCDYTEKCNGISSIKTTREQVGEKAETFKFIDPEDAYVTEKHNLNTSRF